MSPSIPGLVPESHRILIVDDDADIRVIIRQSLAANGYEISEAEDGISAQQSCLQQLPDLVILDLMMPRMTGMEFVQWFREEYKEPFVPVLMLTALGDMDHKVEGITGGADDYLVKPFNYRELAVRVEALLRIKTLTNALYRRTGELEQANQQLSEMQATLISKERELVAMQMAGATAHNLGQPLTTVLLHCRVLEKSLAGLDNSLVNKLQAPINAIKAECATMNEVVGRLQVVNAGATETYVGSSSILDLGRGK